MNDADMTLHTAPSAWRNRFGPRVCGAETLFQLWAPGAGMVSLCIDGQAPVPLSRAADGMWQVWHPAGAGTRYRFAVDGSIVPDPASRFQPEDVLGPSEVIDAGQYVWKHPDWRGRAWEETVLYELHAGILGGYAGILDRLADLAAIGVTAVQLMPIADFAGARNWGYDGALPFAPDHEYGTPDALRALIDAAHGHGLMVFLDVVYNHFGPAGNFLPDYAPEFFDPARQTPWGPAIDFGNQQVRRFFIENALYWLTEFRFDGLRLDAVHAISQRDWLVELAEAVRTHCAGRHVHLVVENEHNDAPLLQSGFNAQWNDDFHNVMHVLLTGEKHAYYSDFADRPAEKLASCLAEGFVYQGQNSVHLGGRSRGTKSGHLPPTAFVNFLQNHDQVGNRAFGERLTSLAPQGALRAALALLLLAPPIPMLFMGEEYGSSEPFLFFTDFAGELGTAVRDGRRREFESAPGFSSEESWQKILDPNHPDSFAASRWRAEGQQAASWREWTAQLLRLRHERIVPVLAGTVSLGAGAVGPACVRAGWRMGNGETLTLISNLGADAVCLDLPAAAPLFGQCFEHGRIEPFTTLAWMSA